MNALYAAALRLLPADVRERHAEQMAAVFGEVLRDARRHGGFRGVVRVTARELIALLHFAWCEHSGRPTPRRIDERMHAWSAAEEGRTGVLASFTQDLGYAVRMLRRAPGFTFVCVSTMALAVGANTAIFSLINGILIRDLPYHRPDRLVVLGHHTDGGASLDATTPGNLYDWMRAATAFDSIAGFAQTERIVTWNGNAERIRGGVSVGSVFDVLGRQAAQGRTPAASDDQPGSAATVVLSARLARRLFGERSPLGEALGINSVPHTVIGVMPADFAFPDYDVEYWIPARFDAAFRNNRDQYFLIGVARLRDGLTLEQSRLQLDTVMDAIRREYPQFTQNATAAVAPLKEVLLGDVRTRLMLLMGAVAFVLLIACANLGNLLLARAAERRREFAVRQAIGARALRLVRQLLTESLVLAALGGTAGLALGVAMLRALLALLPENIPRLKGVELDLTVLLFTAGISVASGLAFGFFPALQLATRAPMEPMREGSRGSTRGRWVRAGLVVSELALTLVLLAGAGLLVRSFAKLLDVPPGFRFERLLTFSVSIPGSVYDTPERRLGFFERATERLERLPGAQTVTLTTTLPVAGRGNGAWLNLIERPLPPDQTPPGVPNRVVRPNYFRALGIPLVAGREFTEDDGLDGTRAVIVSESVARRFLPGEDAVGKHLYMGTPDNRVVPDSEIVGVVADVKQAGLDEERSEAVYAPQRLVPSITNFTFAIRTATDPASLAPAVRAALRELDPGVPVVRLQTMDTLLARSTAPTRSTMLLLALFAGVAVALAIVGVFGVLSYTVSLRTLEFGIRIALGATGRSVTLLVLGQGLASAGVGLALGLAGAAALTRFMRTLLFGVTPTDPASFAGAALLLAAVAALASYVPARRATRVDPVTVLRHD